MRRLIEDMGNGIGIGPIRNSSEKEEIRYVHFLQEKELESFQGR